jgi:hypothetical protein
MRIGLICSIRGYHRADPTGQTSARAVPTIQHRQSGNGLAQSHRILALPELTLTVSLRWATCFGEQPGHVLFSKPATSTPPPAPDLTAGLCVPPPRRLCSVPGDGVIKCRSIDYQVTFTRLASLCSVAQCNNILQAAQTDAAAVLALPWEKWARRGHLCQ